MPRFHPSLLALALLGCAPPAQDPDDLPPDDAPTQDAGPSPRGVDAGGTVDGPDAGTSTPPDGGPGSADAGGGAAVADGGGSPADGGAVGGGSVDAGALPTFEAFFSTRPADDSRSITIEDRLVGLIDAAVPGSSIRVAVFRFTRAAPAQALLRAAGRGVDVRVVVDGDADASAGSEVGTLRTGLGAARVHSCDAPGTACVGSGIMHHKTFLFSALADGSREVVVQASHNLSTNQLTMHNDAVLVRGDAALYRAYLRTWEDLERDVEVPDAYRIDDGDLATRLYVFPRPGGGDTAESIIGNVTCDASARLRVAMAFFTDARLAVAQALAARAREGCDVRVVAGDDELPLGTQVDAALAAGGVQVTRYPARGGGWGLHSKYLLVEARYAGSATPRRLVFTGSHNWTGPALTINDETLLRVEDDGVFAAYLANWAHVRASAARP